MAVDSRRNVSLGPSTTEEILTASRGNNKFVTLMKTAVGLAIGTDGIEVTLLSYLVPCVAAEWGLTSLEQGSLTASVFAGELVGAIFLGMLSDAYGRRPSFQVATLLVVLFGLSTTFATSFWWLLLFRSLVGVGAGGMEVPFDLLGELITHREKSRILVDVQVMWAMGSLFVGFAAWAILSFGHSWRLLALVSAVPPLTVLCCFGFIPESPRWLIANGREQEAKAVLRKIAEKNGIELTAITIVPEEKPKDRHGGVANLWRRPELRSRTIVSCIIWAAFGFLYYGVILLSSKVMGESDECTFDYSILLFASASELVANFVTRFYVDSLDKRLSMLINFAVSAVMTVLMPVNSAMAWLLVTSFLARGTSYVAACLAWVVTPELYPTQIRSTGHAMSNAFARIGAIGASYWVATPFSNEWIAAGLCVVGVIGGLTAQGLPSGHRPELDDHGGVSDDGESRPLLQNPMDIRRAEI